MELREAKNEDLDGITQVFKACWPEDKDDLEGLPLHFARQRKQVDNAFTILSTKGGHINGFLNAFFTTDTTGNPRLEIDLLGVDTAARRQGVGKRLVQAAESLAAARAPFSSRVVVALENAPMNKLMEALGYKPSEQRQLLVKPGSEAQTCKKAHCEISPGFVVVHTFRYSGIWVEKGITEECLRQAEEHRLALGLEVVGMLVDSQNTGCIEVARQQGFEDTGSYRFWEKHLVKHHKEQE